jgi:hypothetical protein
MMLDFDYLPLPALDDAAANNPAGRKSPGRRKQKSAKR